MTRTFTGVLTATLVATALAVVTPAVGSADLGPTETVSVLAHAPAERHRLHAVVARGVFAGRVELTAPRLGSVKVGALPRSWATPRTRVHSRRDPSHRSRQQAVDCARVHCVALTFDDGPGPDTPRLLSMLAELHIKATFFLVGSEVVEHPDIARQIASAGHQLGNHSWSHANLALRSAADIRAEVRRTQRVVKKTTGRRPTALRPPYGELSAAVAAEAGEDGLPVVTWDVDPRDWADRDSAVVTQRVLDAAAPGSIVLLHDVQPTTVDAVPAIVRGLRSRGYVLVTVDRLLGDPVAGRIYRSR